MLATVQLLNVYRPTLYIKTDDKTAERGAEKVSNGQKNGSQK
jgi:hypothetical protein